MTKDDDDYDDDEYNNNNSGINVSGKTLLKLEWTKCVSSLHRSVHFIIECPLLLSIFID